MPKQPAQTTHSLQVQGDWYHVRRRGSRYNIFGPGGRVFTSYQSAGVAGPRWEELTRTPWPHPSSAYRPGLRLAQLDPASAPVARVPAPAPKAAPAPQPGPYEIVKVRRRAPLAEPVQERLQDPTIRALLERESSGTGPEARRARQALEAVALPLEDTAFEIRRGEQTVAGPYATLLIARAVKVALIERDLALLRDPAALPPGLPAPRVAALPRREPPPPVREPVQAPRLDRDERLRRNRQRNAQRAARIDAQAILTQHVAWQVEQRRAAKNSEEQQRAAKSS